MVLGSAMCALNLASSAMVNGVCCIYQMQEEEERQKAQHEAIRLSIRSEYERNRRLEMEERLREREMKELAMYTSQLREERRRNLMAQKTRVTNTSSSSSSSFKSKDSKRRTSSSREPPLSDESPVPDAVLETSTPTNSATSCSGGITRRFEFCDPLDNSTRSNSRRSLHLRSNGLRYCAPPIRLTQSCTYMDLPKKQMSSLLDESSDDEDDPDVEEEEATFEEIPIE